MTFKDELQSLINRHSMEAGSDTPDFILAQYLQRCLEAWNEATKARDRWYKNPQEDVGSDRPKPCPTCGSSTGLFYDADCIFCNTCGHRGPKTEGLKERLKKWNAQ